MFLKFSMQFLKNIHEFSELNLLVILWSYYVKSKLLPNLRWPIKRVLNSMNCCLKSQGLCFWLEVGIWGSRARVLGLFIQRSTLKVWTSKKKKAPDFGKVPVMGTSGSLRTLGCTELHALEHLFSVWQKLINP